MVAAEHVVVRERVAEEVRAFDARGRSATSSSSWHMNVVTHAMFGFTASPIGTPSCRERLVVVVDPVLRLFGVDERERERADALLRGEVDRVAAAARDPQRRVRLLHAASGTTLRGGIVT